METDVRDVETKKTCCKILSEVTEILDLFTVHLNCFCVNKEQPFASHLGQLFPEKSFIDHEFNVLKSLLKEENATYLKILLDYWKTSKTIVHVHKGCINLSTHYNTPPSDNMSVLQNMININKETSGETCVSLYQDYCIHYSNYSESIISLIVEWSKSNVLLKFLYSLTATDIDNILEVVNDWDETLINTKTVLEFVLLKRFFDQIDNMIKDHREKQPLQFQDIISYFKQLLEKTEFNNILASFAFCSSSLFSIQHIYMTLTNKEKSKRNRILDIMKESYSYFDIRQSKEAVTIIKYVFDVQIKSINWKPISFDGLNELRDRARLVQYSSNNGTSLQNYTDGHIHELRLFVSFVDTIEIILQNLTSLYTSNYPVEEQYRISKQGFLCKKGNFDELNKFKSSLETPLIEWEKQLCSMYKKCINLTYFSYQQIWMVEDALYKHTAIIPDNPTYHFLKFIDIDPQSIQIEIVGEKKQDPIARLENMGQLLKSQFDNRNLSLQGSDEVNKKVFLIETTNNGILRAIYSFLNLNHLSLSANKLFYCSINTNWIEIRGFIYRCFYSQALYQLIRPELLSSVIQDKFAQLLNQMIEQNPNHLFRLSIITMVPSADVYIVSSLKRHSFIQIIRDQHMHTEDELAKIIERHIDEKCILVTSEIAGLGKSTYIQNEISRLGKKRVHFPINGDVDIDALTERLRYENIQSTPSRIAIHIDIGAVENVQHLNEFLYCLVLFRCFRLGQMPVDVSTDIPIYIEIDASSHLKKLIDNIIIFKYLKTKHLARMNWDELNVSNSPSVQFVCNYLQTIENKLINTYDINEENIIALDKVTCIHLLQNHFLQKKSTEFVSWAQLSIFISIYYKLFSDFSRCVHFMANPEDKSTLRIDLLSSLLHASHQFTSLSVETVRKNQSLIYTNETNYSFSEAIIRWDNIQPFIVIFTATYDPLFVYKTPSDIPSSVINEFTEYFKWINTRRITKTVSKRKFFSWFSNKRSSTDSVLQVTKIIKNATEQLQEFLVDYNKMTHEQFFLKLTQLSTKYFIKKSICMKCFKQYEYTRQQCTNCETEDILIRPRVDEKNEDIQNIEDFQKRIAEKLHSEYVLTADNYIKMLLIYLRVQSKLPVLIMGETGKVNSFVLFQSFTNFSNVFEGCGKTALIQFLCQKILDDDMEVFHIHAGVTNEKIIETMRKYINIAHEYLEKDQNKRLWIFFDEFNTTSSIGLLKEIVCQRTLLGEILPKNMVFLGACNPQRRKKKKENADDDISIKKYYSDIRRQSNIVDSSLLYSVVSIPETMLEHVWDYGYLDEATETSYIKAILNICDELTSDYTWFNCIVNLLAKSQKWFRKHEDVSSVSLRDVTRFCRFYNWFYNRALSCEKNEASTLHCISYIERASILALFLCYYFRLNTSVQRNTYISNVEKSIKKFKPVMPCNSLNTLLEQEKMNLINRMTLPEGTAKNRCLTDNIFVLFTCILNRIPVILCGKPGSSKTLAAQIVISNLKGTESKDIFFQTLPRLITVSYQGSLNCTSESIIEVFARADKYIEAKSAIQPLPVIVFDEIGLAELSPHNPLKVLHSELEAEICRHSFIGLSNWCLDASKMNRVTYIACPDLDLEDLKITTISLSKSMISDETQAIPLDKSTIEGLAIAYIEMCDHLLQYKSQYYYGLRDYYSLIKGIVHDMLEKEHEHRDLYKIIRYHLSINFSGIIDASTFMWSKLCKHTRKSHISTQYLHPTFGQLIDRRRSLCTGRFLMLISDNESSFDYIQRYINIKHPSVQTHTIIGSTLTADFLSDATYNEQYNNRVLMDIILYAEKNVTLFLRGLGHLYDNLYDLFNQNFAVSAKKKYCRIALGSLYHPRCIIHENFYCVVFVKQQDFDKYDLPFLNRFEKHLIDLNTLIHERQKIIISKLDDWVKQLILMKSNESFLTPKYLFIEFNNNYILNLVTEVYDQLNIADNYDDDDQQKKITQDIIKYCQNQMIRTSSFDFPLLLSLNSQMNNLIQKYYEIHIDLSFSLFINQLVEQEKIPKLLIYTYTQIYDVIDYSHIKKYQTWMEEVKLSHFKTELELIQKIKTHYQTGPSRLLFIRIDCHQEHQHISMLKHIIMNEQIIDQSRSVCLLFHLQRNKN